MHEALRKAVEEALKRVAGIAVPFQIEHPEDLSHGDYAVNVALVAARQAGQSPKQLAEALVAELLNMNLSDVESIAVAGPGFINFTLKADFFKNSISHIAAVGDEWGRSAALQGKKVIVEYSQPNPFKPFHIGHLMSTTIGESISRLVEFSGADIFRANYQGDIGPHVAKCIWGLEREGLHASSVEDLGKAYVAGYAAYEDDPVAKSEIDAINKKLYVKDPAYDAVYQEGRKVSLEHFADLYRILGTTFNKYYFESEVAGVGIAIVKEGIEKGIFEESEGAIVYRGEKHGLHTRVFITKQGTPTYEAKELGLMNSKRNDFAYDRNITTVAVEQDSYFKVVEKAMDDLWPDIAGRYTHVTFGMMQLTSGKMSSRKGNVITGESLLQEMREKAFEKMGDRDLGDAKARIADQVAVAAIKYSILKQGTGKNIIFNPESSLSFDGDSGPYLQYAHTRAQSVLRKARAEGVYAGKSTVSTVSLLERVLYRFPEVVLRAEREHEPHHVTTYLTQLAGDFNAWYAGEKIVDPTDPESPYRVLITECFAQTMRRGLWLLGIEAPTSM